MVLGPTNSLSANVAKSTGLHGSRDDGDEIGRVHIHDREPVDLEPVREEIAKEAALQERVGNLGPRIDVDDHHIVATISIARRPRNCILGLYVYVAQVLCERFPGDLDDPGVELHGRQKREPAAAARNITTMTVQPAE